MAKGYSISIASDTKAFLTGVQKGIIDPLEDAADVIEELGSESGRDLDKLEKAMRDAQSETDDVRKGFSDLQKEIRETGRKSRTDFANPVNKSARDVGNQLDEVTNEAKQNAAEMFSSFDGSFESIADAAQSTLGGLVGGLKGIPAIAAVAAGAAGLGLVTSTIIGQIDDAKELKDALTDAYKAAAEEGRNYLDEAAIISAASDIMFDTGKREAAAAAAAKIGVDTNTYIRALAGDADALEFSLDQARTASGDLVRDIDSARGGESWTPAVQAIDTVVDRLQGLSDMHDDNSKAATQYQDLVAEQSTAQREQIARVRSVEQERFEAMGRSYDTAAARPPLIVKTTLRAPDIEAARRTWQGNFEKMPVQVRAEFVDRFGRRPI